MSDMRRILPILMLFSGFVLAGCASEPAPQQGPDITDQRVLLVGFSPNEQVRLAFENQLYEALRERDVESVQSHRLIPSYAAIEHATILATAADTEANLILMVRRLAIAADDSGTRVPRDMDAANRAYRTLQSFLASADQRPATPPPPSRQVVEVYGYALERTGARLIWSGYSWVDFDGDLDRAIGETAELIANNMAQSRDAVRATRGVPP